MRDTDQEAKHHIGFRSKGKYFRREWNALSVFSPDAAVLRHA